MACVGDGGNRFWHFVARPFHNVVSGANIVVLNTGFMPGDQDLSDGLCCRACFRKHLAATNRTEPYLLAIEEEDEESDFSFGSQI